MNFIDLVARYEQLVKEAKIKKIKNKYRVVSLKGKNLGTYDTREEAVKRLRQVEFFKYKKASHQDADFSYASVCRELSDDDKLDFQKSFKNYFDTMILADKENPEELALIMALQEVKIKKVAAKLDMGSPEKAAQNLAAIITFLMQKISPESRPRSLFGLKQKIQKMNAGELGSKNMPASSAIGQAIVFVKNSLMGHDSAYINAVINALVQKL